MKTKIFLTGFRGSGKTTLARLLAEKLNFELIEMDELIVKQAGKSIAEITRDGKEWLGFRQLENSVLKHLLKKNKIVVATGGGLFVNDIKFSEGLTFGEYNYNLVNPVRKPALLHQSDRHYFCGLKKQLSNGVKDLSEKFVIFLKVNEDTLKKRLKEGEFGNYNKKWRPPLCGNPKVRPEEEIKIYRKRLPLYELRSDLIIDVSKQTLQESLKEILKIL